jgi:hypothetical protein
MSSEDKVGFYVPQPMQWERSFPFWEGLLIGTYPPPPPRSIGIKNLGDFRDLIYGLQLLRGKILSRKGLGHGFGFRQSRFRLTCHRFGDLARSISAGNFRSRLW